MARTIEPAQRLLGELFTNTARVLFSADTGAGKTMIGLSWAFAMSLGRDFMHWRADRPARVVYIDGEMSRDELQHRIALFCRCFAIEPPADNLFIVCKEDFDDMPPLDIEIGQVWLEENVLDALKPDFVIFDNLMSLCSRIMKEEESWQMLLPFVLKLTKQRIGQLWIHHTGHDKSRAYGTKTREWHMDTVIVGQREQGDSDVQITLRFDKTRRRRPENETDFHDVRLELNDHQWTGEQVSRSPGRPNKCEKIALEALRAEGGKASFKTWRDKSLARGICKSKKRGSQGAAFRRAREGLVEAGKVVKEDEIYVLAE
jgi:hypothetical protein